MDGTLQLIVNIGAAATALAAVIGLPMALVKLWPLLKRAVTIGASLEKLPEMASEIAAQSGTLATIKHELFANSGLSLRDQTNRLEKQSNEMVEKLDEHLKACPAPTTTINVNGGTP